MFYSLFYADKIIMGKSWFPAPSDDNDDIGVVHRMLNNRVGVFFFIIFFFLLNLEQPKWNDYYVRISWYGSFMVVAQNMENGITLYVYFRYTCIAIYYNNYNFENNHPFFVSSFNILMKQKYEYGYFYQF